MTSIYVVLVIYMCILFGIGVWCTKRNQNVTDFLLAGRSLTVIPATLTITASLFGGGLLTGSTQYAYDSGPMMLVYGATAGLGMLCAAFLVHKMANFSKYSTLPEFLEDRFGSKFLRVASGMLSMIALIGILGGQVAAVVGILNALGFENALACALFAMVVIIALTAMGGLLAVTVTDAFQIILVIIGVVWIFVVSMGEHGWFSGVFQSLNEMSASLPQDYNVFMNGDKALSLTWMILPGVMYTMIGQDVYQRLFGCKDHNTAIKASLFSFILLSIICVMPVFLGLLARIDFPELAANGTSASAFATLAMATLPSWGVGIIMAAALSAILSTADSLLSAAASHFMNDFWMIFIAKDADPNDKKLLWVSRVFTVIGGAAAVLVSLLVPTILDACFYSYYIFTGGVFAPIIFGVFWKGATKQGAIAGLLVGALFVILSTSGIFSLGGIPGELFSGAVSSVVLVIVSLITKNQDSKLTQV